MGVMNMAFVKHTATHFAHPEHRYPDFRTGFTRSSTSKFMLEQDDTQSRHPTQRDALIFTA
jgi:kynurenine formamidase